MNDFTKKIRLGTRASNLALSQVAEVHLLIADFFPEVKIEVIPIVTSGDKIQDKNLAEIGGKGLFIKELEEALINNKIDVAVHSSKDIPPIIHQDTEICAFTKILDPRDCFVSKKYSSFKKLPRNAVIGTSSTRRKAYILKERPDLKIVNFRGNIDTRLGKIENDEVDGAILAVSGLMRLGKEHKITEIFNVEKMLPSGGQGSLALQIREKDKNLSKILQKVNDETTQICVKSERAFLRELGASCTTPVGAYAYIEKKKLILKTSIIDYDGSEIFETISKCDIFLEKAIELGVKAGEQTKKKAQKLLQKII
jgi:hydroxymethylbilane synthase